MDSQDRLQELAHIRGLMERSTRFLSLSGLSGVIAGSLGLIGAFAAQRYMWHHRLFTNDRIGSTDPDVAVQYWQHAWSLGSIAIAVLLLALAVVAWFTWRRGRNTGQGLWDRSAQRALVNLMIPLFAGGIFCIALLIYQLPGLIPPATLIFYGLGLLNASKYTLDEIRWLAISELVLGLLASFWIGAGLIFWAIGFGVLHIFYGTLMYMRHERKTVEK